MASVLHSSNDSISALTSYHWEPQPRPAQLINRLLTEFLDKCPFAADLSQRMLDETGTRLVDWIDHFGLPGDDPVVGLLPDVGYQLHDVDGDQVYQHSGGLFPRIRIHSEAERHLAIKVDSVADFLFVNRLPEVPIAGMPFSPLRTALVAQGSGANFYVVERCGSSHFVPRGDWSPLQLSKRFHHEERLRLRRRDFETDAEGFVHANELIDAAIDDLGRDTACALFFQAERQYWQLRNRAGRIQSARQNALGLGWANHDHHTYRSSRECFVPLIAFLEKLGFQCRERFYAGREAGWGAQVIEHPITGVTIFADVDLSPEELVQDFSHDPLLPRSELGTVGLWCALHGEAFLQAGMHHLECQFDFSATRDQLKAVGIETMPPFTDFPYLRQAFTRGEQWSVNPSRIERLRMSNRITNDQAQQFMTRGALGSHLEILQRDDGYKGFNQTGINEIISATDPRRLGQSQSTR